MKNLGIPFLVATIVLFTSSYLPAAEENSREALMYRILGYQYQRQGNFFFAVNNYKKAAELDPFYACPHNDLGILYEKQKNLNEAEKEYLKAIEIDPHYLAAYSNLALLYEKKQDFKKAISYWQKRAELGNPNDTWTSNAANRVLTLSNRLVKEQVEPKPKSKKRVDVNFAKDEGKSVNWGLRKSEGGYKEEETAEAKEEAIQKTIKEANRYLADKNYKLAKKLFTKAVALDPNNKEAIFNLEIVNLELQKGANLKKGREEETRQKHIEEQKAKEESRKRILEDRKKAKEEARQKALEDKRKAEEKAEEAYAREEKTRELNRQMLLSKQEEKKIQDLAEKGISYYRHNQYEKAAATFREVLKSQPENKEVQGYINEIRSKVLEQEARKFATQPDKGTR